MRSIFFLTFALMTAVEAFGDNENVKLLDENPCEGLVGSKFVPSSRGCSWYFLCADDKVIREDRCPKGHRLNFEKQICDFGENIECDLDDRWNQVFCPVGRGEITIIPHPYVCSKYTGMNEKH
jgi:Chitin binding Peritrophin-A domain